MDTTVLYKELEVPEGYPTLPLGSSGDIAIGIQVLLNIVAIFKN